MDEARSSAHIFELVAFHDGSNSNATPSQLLLSDSLDDLIKQGTYANKIAINSIYMYIFIYVKRGGIIWEKAVVMRNIN